MGSIFYHLLAIVVRNYHALAVQDLHNRNILWDHLNSKETPSLPRISINPILNSNDDVEEKNPEDEELT